MSEPSRRALVAGLGSVVAAAWPAMPGSAGAEPSNAGAGAALREHAARAGITFGAAVTAEEIGDPSCRTLYEREVSLVTTDLDLKFASLRPEPDVWAFQPADALIGWARRRNLLVRGHTLIWNEDIPDWLKRCSAREVARVFDAHIERVVGRYAGRIHTWDVVNEPFWPDHGKPGGYRQGPWFDALGPNYIARALRRARAVDPAAKLCINEAACEADTRLGQEIRPRLLGLVADLREAGVPLDAIGLQSHLEPREPYDDGRFAAFLHDLAAHTVDLHITELDIDDAGWPDDIAVRDGLVAARTGAFLDAVLAVPAVSTLITWELRDPDSWYVHDALAADPAATRLPRPLPFDEAGRPKAMALAMVRSLDHRIAARGRPLKLL